MYHGFAKLSHRYGNSHAIYGITECYLPPGKCDITAFTPAKLYGIRFGDSGWIQG